MANVSKEQIKAKLAQMFKSKEDCIAIYGLKTKFGGGRSTGFALIYDNADFKKKYSLKTILRRVIFIFLIKRFILNTLQDGLFKKADKTRKQKKEIKGRVKKVRGIAKAKAAAAGGKKEKK